jgi:hypothetical protein
MNMQSFFELKSWKFSNAKMSVSLLVWDITAQGTPGNGVIT